MHTSVVVVVAHRHAEKRRLESQAEMAAAPTHATPMKPADDQPVIGAGAADADGTPMSPQLLELRLRAERRREARMLKTRAREDLRYTDVCRGDMLVGLRRARAARGR